MAGTRRSAWEWFAAGSKRSAREEKPLEYAVQLAFPLLTLIHRSAWKVNSRNFASTEF
jgi:hypothetical protein